MKQRRLQNGDLLFLYDRPDHLEGYTQDPINPKHFRQQKPPCALRDSVKCGTCATPVYKEVCTIGRPLDCVECDERKEP